MITFKESWIGDDRREPLVLEPASSQTDLEAAIVRHRRDLSQRLLDHGAILFRGFAVRSVEDFDRSVGAISESRLEYLYGSTPRTALGNRIFTATEYPPSQEIPLHSEYSYQRVWPMKIALCCLLPAATGGATPIANMPAVTAAIGSTLIDKLGALGIKYVRHYRPFMDVPWQKVFGTVDPEEVARFCADQGIDHTWLEDQTLRTTQVCQGVATHPVRGESVFFNQAHLFHVSSLGPKAAEAMIEMFGREALPRQTFYGNGDEIRLDELAIIRSAFNAHSIDIRWQAGDVLVCDNMQVAHGRRAFTGTRQVVAALMDSYSEAATVHAGAGH